MGSHGYQVCERVQPGPQRLVTIYGGASLDFGATETQPSRSNSNLEIHRLFIGEARNGEASDDCPFQACLLAKLPEARLLRRFVQLDPTAGKYAVLLAGLFASDDEYLAALDNDRNCPNSHAKDSSPDSRRHVVVASWMSRNLGVAKRMRYATPSDPLATGEGDEHRQVGIPPAGRLVRA